MDNVTFLDWCRQYVHVREQTEKYKRRLEDSKPLSKKEIIQIKQSLNNLNWAGIQAKTKFIETAGAATNEEYTAGMKLLEPYLPKE